MRALLAFYLLSLAIPGLVRGETVERLASPNGELVITVNLTSTRLTYKVDRRGTALLGESGLGLGQPRNGYEVRDVERRAQRTRWRPVYGERSEYPDRFNEMRLKLDGLELELRAYDEGIAFRYIVVSPAEISFAAEETEFSFPAGTKAWEEHGTEGPYELVPVEKIQENCERPLTVQYPGGQYASLTEAGLIDYPRMLLSPVAGKPGTLRSHLAGPVNGTAPLETPWRVLVVGDRPGDLLERSYLVLNLSPPNRIKDTSWIKPGKVMREVTLSTAGGKALVDFAVAHKLDYIEYDAGWYGHEYDETQDATTITPDPERTDKIEGWAGLELREVIDYARERDIGVFLYVNRRQLERQRDVLFPLFRQWGVAGVKFGFVQVGPQEWSEWLHESVAAAAEHELMVDIHDQYRPTGVSRTWPNLLTQEGIRGNEHMPTAEHNTTLPFTRFVAGAGDATVCYYSDRIKTTRAHQLAVPVVYYSPLQFLFWYDRPSAYQGEPEVKFFEDVPTTWDDTRVLAGEIGHYVAVARRKGQQWFLGALNNSEPRELELALDFLAPATDYRAEIYRDGAGPKDVKIETRTLRSTDTLRLQLAPSGGQAVRLFSLDDAMSREARSGAPTPTVPR
jgi:alpha-glucosidase